MMPEPPVSKQDLQLWREVDKSEYFSQRHVDAFLERAQDRVALLKYAVGQRNRRSHDILFIYRHLFPLFFWDELDALPKEWLREHVEGWIRPILKPDDDFGYVQLLGWLSDFYPELELILAHEAIQSKHPDVVEAGREYLEDLENPE